MGEMAPSASRERWLSQGRKWLEEMLSAQQKSEQEKERTKYEAQSTRGEEDAIEQGGLCGRTLRGFGAAWAWSGFFWRGC